MSEILKKREKALNLEKIIFFKSENFIRKKYNILIRKIDNIFIKSYVCRFDVGICYKDHRGIKVSGQSVSVNS